MQSSPDPVASLVQALSTGAAEVVDLTQPLDENTPVIQLPEQFAQTPPLKRHEISGYDEAGPAWAWSWLELGEHTGTHLDAPVHWISGRDGRDVSQIPARHLVAPAVVIDKSAETAENPDYLLTVEEVRSFEARHGSLPDDGWLLLRTGWSGRAHDADLFLNAPDGQPHSPGFDPECVRWIAEESQLAGVGVESVGIDAGLAAGFEPPFPAHYYLMGAGKYGLTQLTNLEVLPPTGALLIVAPLKLTGGTGSPVRALALVPTA